MSVCLLAVISAALAPVARASSNGMDMGADGAMSLASGTMLPYFHFTSGDMLWFMGWVPASAGAMVGTCIGLFLLGVVDRWIAASWAMMEAHWADRAHLSLSNQKSIDTVSDTACSCEAGEPSPVSSPSLWREIMRTTPPFKLTHDIVRGVLHVVQSAMHFTFMLAIMTCQLGFIFSIVVGFGTGEMLFGRFGAHGEPGRGP